jgi:hypothetical protein
MWVVDVWNVPLDKVESDRFAGSVELLVVEYCLNWVMTYGQWCIPGFLVVSCGISAVGRRQLSRILRFLFGASVGHSNGRIPGKPIHPLCYRFTGWCPNWHVGIPFAIAKPKLGSRGGSRHLWLFLLLRCLNGNS